MPPLRSMCAKHRPQKGNRGGGLGMRCSYDYILSASWSSPSASSRWSSLKIPACLMWMASWRLRLTALTYRGSAQHCKKIRRISRRFLLPGAVSRRPLTEVSCCQVSFVFCYRPTVGVQSEYIRSTVGVQSEYNRSM